MRGISAFLIRLSGLEIAPDTSPISTAKPESARPAETSLHAIAEQAAGSSGYFQPVKFTVTQIVEKDSSLAIVKAGQVTPLSLGDDAARKPAQQPGLEARDFNQR